MKKLTRLEVIDETGRAYVRHGVSVELSHQDDGRTLKVFVKARSPVKNPITGSWTKREDRTGKFIHVKADPKPFKGVRRDK